MAPVSTQPIKLVSLRRHFLGLLIGVIALFALGTALSLIFGMRAHDAAEMRMLHLEASQTRASVLRRWEYYRELTTGLAHDPRVATLMTTGSVAEKEAWAISRRGALPGVLGLALVNPQGEIQGDPGRQGLQPSCEHDARRPVPPQGTFVHHDQTGPEHIDLMVNVPGPGGEVLGNVLLSIRIVRLQRILSESVQPGHTMAVVDASGRPVVSTGNLRGPVREVTEALPALGWTLVVQARASRISPGGWLQSIGAGMLTLTGVLLLLVAVAVRLRGPVLQDIAAGRDALVCLTRGESAPAITTRYAEFAPIAADINRIAQQLHDQREQLAMLSLTDPLTDLPNRRAFEMHFPKAQGLAGRHHPAALVMLDIDHFKGVNDRFGHDVGDQVLLALARSLKTLTRRADLAARLAGDEFAVLMTDLDAAGVQAWYTRLAEHFAGELATVGLDLQTGISAGHAWLTGSSTDTLNAALIRADRALYEAKARGRGQLALAADIENDAG